MIDQYLKSPDHLGYFTFQKQIIQYYCLHINKITKVIDKSSMSIDKSCMSTDIGRMSIDKGCKEAFTKLWESPKT